MTDKQLADRYGLYWELEVFERLQSLAPVVIKPFGRLLRLSPIFVPDETEPAKWSSDHYWTKGTLERLSKLRRDAEDDFTLFLRLWRDWLDREPDDRKLWAMRCGLSHQCFESVLQSIERCLRDQNLRQPKRADRACARRLMYYHEAKSRFVRWALYLDAGTNPFTASDVTCIACDSALAGRSPLPGKFYAAGVSGIMCAVMSLDKVPGPPIGSPRSHVQFVSSNQNRFERFRIEANNKGWRFDLDDFKDAVPAGNPPDVLDLLANLGKRTYIGTLAPVDHPGLEGVWFVKNLRGDGTLPIYLDDNYPDARAGRLVEIRLQKDCNGLVVAKVDKPIGERAKMSADTVAASNAPAAPFAMDAPDITVTPIPASHQIAQGLLLHAILVECGTIVRAKVPLGDNSSFGPFDIDMSTAGDRDPAWTNCMARIVRRIRRPEGWCLMLRFEAWFPARSDAGVRGEG